LPVAATEPVADDEVTVDIHCAAEPVERGQLFNITGPASAEVNLYAIPTLALLSYSGVHGIFDWRQAYITCETERSGHRRSAAQGH